MLTPRQVLLLTIAACSGAVMAQTSARLEASADPVSARITPVSEGRKLVSLPSLEFRIGVDARCSDDEQPRSVSVSVADTRTTLSGDGIIRDATNFVSLTVPASQIAPIPVNEFCTSEDWADRQMLVADAVTAHLSLRCGNEQGESIIYATRQLAVALTCESASQADPESPILR